MDEIKPQNKISLAVKQHDLEARLYDLQKQLDEIFHSMAVQISSLYLEKNIKVPTEELTPLYQKLDAIHQEIKKIAALKTQPQILTPPAPQLTPLLKNSLFNNQTLTKTTAATLKLKVRSLDTKNQPSSHASQKLPTSSTTQLTEELPIVASPELLRQIEQKRLKKTADDSTLTEYVEANAVKVKIKPQRRF